MFTKRLNTTGTAGQPFANDEELSKVKRFLEKLETGYDTAALESYATFKALRDEGVVPQGVKFQVCIPTPMQVISSAISHSHKTFVEPYYAAALHRALDNIQAGIPHDDLCIQIDCAHEFGVLEGIWKEGAEAESQKFTPWWLDISSHPPSQAAPEAQNEKIFEGAIERIVSFAGPKHIPASVELGFHLCYGDIGHKHFVEPKDMRIMAKVANAVLTRLKTGDGAARKVAYIHMPVPKERDDIAYFSPLKDERLLSILREGGTTLYLGVVREGHEAGTKRRVDAARKVIDKESGVAWGVASECGMGRTPREMVDSVLQIMKNVSKPVRLMNSML